MRPRQESTPRTVSGTLRAALSAAARVGAAAWLLPACLATGLRAEDLRFTGTLEHTDVSIRWASGTYCDVIGQEGETRYIETAISIPLEVRADPTQSCLASSNLVFTGTFSVDLPMRTPPGTLTIFRSLRFDTPMVSSVALDGTLVLDSPIPSNTFELSAEVSHSAPGPTCPSDRFEQGPGIPPGSYPVALSSTCRRESMSFPTEEGSTLIYEIRHYGSLSLLEPFFPFGDKTLVLGSFEAVSYYRVSTVLGIGLDPSAIEFDLGRSLTDPPPEPVRLENLGNGDLQFEIATDRPWLSVTPESGTLATRESVQLEVRVAAALLTEEEEKAIAGNIVVTGNSPDSPQIVPVFVRAPVAELIGLEVTQGVQDWNNSVPLVEGRFAFVRAQLRSLRKGPVRVRARLRGTRDGVSLTGSPLSPQNAGGALEAQPQAVQLRGDLNQSLWFVLWFSDWTQGQVALSLESEPGEEIACAESAGTPRDCRVDVAFGPRAELPIRWVLIDWKEADGTEHRNAANADRPLWLRLYASLPVSFGDRGTTRIQWGGSVPPREEDVLPELDKMQLLAFLLGDPEPDRIYYGAIAGEEISGLAQDIPSSVAAGYLPAGEDAEGRLTHVHEIGHCLGRHHATFCGAVAGPGAPVFPYVFEIGGQQRPTLGPMTNGSDAIVYGLEMHRERVVDPFQFFELMSYCGKPPVHFWPSKFTYEGILATLRARAAAARLAAGGLSDPGAASTVQLLRGQIDFLTGEARWLPFMTLHDVALPALPAPGEYSLRFLDAQGALWREVPFEPNRYEGMGGESHAGAFLVAVERDPAVRQVRLLHDNVLLASQSASPNPPLVRVLFPNGGESLAGDEVTFAWTAQDADGDPLVFDLQCSRDDGATWLTLVTAWPGQQYAITREMAPATNQGRVRVFAHDGFHTAEDTSDGTFSSANHPPRIAIAAPTPFELVTGSQQVSFSAEAWDVEDGYGLAAIEWASSLDGALGQGPALAREASTLGEGTHRITARIADAAGAVAQAEVDLVVGRATPADLADLALAMWAQPGAVEIGESFVLTATIANHGPAPATAVALALPVPDGVAPGAVATTHGACELAGDTLLCELGALDPGEQAVVTWNLTPGAAGTVLVEGTAAGAEADPRPADNSAWVEVQVRSGASANLLRNPGAEGGAGSRTGSDVLPIPGWVTAANFTAGLYGGRDLLTTAESERIGGGANFFYGGPSTPFSSARQVVDVSAEALAIDGGQRRAVLSARLGTLGDGGDEAQVRAEFLDQQGAVLDQTRLGPVQDTAGELRAESAAASVPARTRQIRVSLESTRQQGTSNDGCFDNISLTLEAEEPAAVSLSIARSGASVLLGWPVTLVGARLEQADSAEPGATWSLVAAVPEVAGGEYRLLVPATERAQFFRLRR